MDSCWQNTPKEIVNYILKLACSRLIYCDNRYIEIGKLNYKETGCINTFLDKKNSLKSEFQFIDNINRSWFLEFKFDGFLYEKNIIKGHGLSFDYLENNNLEICYWKYRKTVSDPSLTGPWTRIMTIMN